MKKTFYFILIVAFLASCEQNTPKSKNVKKMENKEAVKYYEMAQELHPIFSTERDTVLKAIALLDSAITLEPDYFPALLSKQSFQTRLGEYKEALETIKHLEELDPGNSDIKSMAGIFHLINNEHEAARIKLQQADSLWSLMLDTVSPVNKPSTLHILMNKAILLKLLQQEDEADKLLNKILNDTLFNTESYKGAKEDIKSNFLHKSKEEVYTYFIESLRKNEL